MVEREVRMIRRTDEVVNMVYRLIPDPGFTCIYVSEILASVSVEAVLIVYIL